MLGPGFLPPLSSSTTTLATYVVCYTHAFHVLEEMEHLKVKGSDAPLSQK